MNYKELKKETHELLDILKPIMETIINKHRDINAIDFSHLADKVNSLSEAITIHDNDICVICKIDKCIILQHDTYKYISFRLGYIEGAGQLCLDCYGDVYDLKPKLQGMEKLIKTIRKNGDT